jgi:hypothetical protein
MRTVLKVSLFAVAVAILFCTIGWNIYLMLHRPIVAYGTQSSTPPNWLCQTVTIERYCVALSPEDLRVWNILLLLVSFYSAPVILFAGLLHQLRARKDDEAS